ncbi:hypothetical protein FRB99_007997 [Tulasnella sp. 403]|nr:hypothetical protein FRB99_007997 [Tulasnella sp. 403]
MGDTYDGEKAQRVVEEAKLATTEEKDVVADLPPRHHIRSRSRAQEHDMIDPEPVNAPPPSFAQSEFETIIRRQRNNNPHTLKIRNVPSRFPNLNNTWEFAGWGSVSYLEMTQENIDSAADRLKGQPVLLGSFRASSIAGNAMYGSVFYAFPAVAATAGVLSPLSLLVACLILFLFRPIFLELGSAIRFNGASYVYLLQCSGKTMALIAAAAMYLDGVATASVSAATVSAYLSGEFPGVLTGMKEAAIAIAILVLLAAVGLLSLKESSTVTLSFTTIHSIGLFLAYFLAILACLLFIKSRVKIGRVAMWLYDQVTALHQWKVTRGWDASIVKWMSRLRKRPICVWVKTDDIHNLVEAILYVRRNELTARVIFVHAYDSIDMIPSELEANVKILDEAFPGITVDLVFLKGKFSPTLIEAASVKLDVPKSQMFMNTIGTEHPHTLADYDGVRVVNL